MTVDLSDSLVEKLSLRAALESMSVDDYLSRLLAHDEASSDEPMTETPMTGSERARLFRESTAKALALFSDREYPPIPEGAFDSEWLYGPGE